jgi:hypothetical protein
MEPEGSLPSQLGGIYCMHRRTKNEYKSLFVKFEGKRFLGRHRYRWESNTMMDLKETERGTGLKSSAS